MTVTQILCGAFRQTISRAAEGESRQPGLPESVTIFLALGPVQQLVRHCWIQGIDGAAVRTTYIRFRLGRLPTILAIAGHAGARKIVLGLLVDGQKPKLLRSFKASMRQHLYYLQHPNVGPVLHAKKRGFTSVVGLKNHLFGLGSFATQIEPKYGRHCLSELQKVDWPL